MPFTEFVARAQKAAPFAGSTKDAVGNSLGNHSSRMHNDTGGSGIPVRQYPDITHTLSSQFPISGWHSSCKPLLLAP